ncbi:MAG TPA: response regulator transcription factor [Planctomycetaceae bacterium]|nr:response regulator transcription factor [Planctomycetaceae bacterium]
MRTRVVLAEDNAVVAEQLRGVLETDFEVVATVGDGRALLAAVEQHDPDVVVTDITMPVLDGIAATRELKLRRPDMQVVLVSVHQDPELVKQGFEAGALRYVLKTAAGEELLPAVRAALQQPWLPSRGMSG